MDSIVLDPNRAQSLREVSTISAKDSFRASMLGRYCIIVQGYLQKVQIYPSPAPVDWTRTRGARHCPSRSCIGGLISGCSVVGPGHNYGHFLDGKLSSHEKRRI